MAYEKKDDNFSARAARGQAINLAVSVAIAEGKHNDNKFIMLQYIRFLSFANLLQGATFDEVSQAIENPSFIAKLQQLDSDLRNL